MHNNWLEDIQPFLAVSSLGRQDSFVCPRRRDARIVLRAVNYEGGTAADTVIYIPLFDEDETTVDVAAAAAALAIKLKGDDDGKLGGYTVLATDFLVVLTLEGWKMLDITTVAADAGADQIDITAMTGMDGVTGLKAAVAKDNPAYIARTANIITIDVGTTAFAREFHQAGKLNHPLPFFMDSQGANEHSVTGTFGYDNPTG